MRDIIKKGFTLTLLVAFLFSYITFLDFQGWVQVNEATLPLPAFTSESPVAKSKIEPVATSLRQRSIENLVEYKEYVIKTRRQRQIDKVENFFDQYGSPLMGYGYIIVDKAEECGGDYRVLIGIAGSESGLGRINYKLYNPYGYLDGVQYPDQKTALEILSCKVSQQHISVCGTNLTCLGNRYAGPSDDLDHFISKVAWFMKQVS